MRDKNRKIITLLIVFTIIFTVIGSSLAYLKWQTASSQETSVTFTVTSEFSCSANGGNELNSNSVMLAPTDCTNNTYAIQREIKLGRIMSVSSMTIYTDLWLDIVTLDEGLKNSDNFKWVLTQDKNSCDTSSAISSGTFKDLTKDDKVMLLDGELYTDTEEDAYYLYIWLDKEETSIDTMNQDFEFKINGECSNINTKFEMPVLVEGLIPVTIANNGKIRTVSSTDSSWYNYDDKEWANAVLVKENGINTRTYYQDNISNNVEINSKDILAYFVWIPRYAYKIWTTGVSNTGNEQIINISWERAEDNYATATKVNEYMTHPAFWWDTDGDRNIDKGETIAGIWVGKFETTGTADKPTILPNVTSLREQTLSNQFKTALLFSGGSMTNNVISYPESNVTYGLSNGLTSHMMKNSEWGAVAYLSHSVYGVETEVRYNNYNSGSDGTPVTMTGCGAATASTTSSSTTCGRKYGTFTAYPQSTTGNISGIFDMSGGSWERVMGNRANTAGGSGFTSGFFTQASNKKYYDLYLSSIFKGNAETDYNYCTIKTCGGHAISEIRSWYTDFAYFMDSDNPWFTRGGGFNVDVGSGIFNFGGSPGISSGYDSFRTVLTPKSVDELQLVS